MSRMEQTINEAKDMTEITNGSVNVVVVGGGKLASYLTAVIPVIYPCVSVYQISTRVRGSSGEQTKTLNPNEEEEGFADTVGRFEVLIDTLAKEGEDIVGMMRKKHGLKLYISTMTRTAEIFKESGVLKGPGKVKQYSEGVVSAVERSLVSGELSFRGIDVDGASLILQSLIDAGATNDDRNVKSNEVNVRGGDVRDLWEQTTWPRDSEGMNVRFGFPPPVGFGDEEDNEDEVEGEGEEYEKEMALIIEGSMELEEERSPPGASGFGSGSGSGSTSASVTSVKNISDVSSEISDNNENAVLFLSAPWCRTCKYMTPSFNRLSRQEPEVKFCKVSISSEEGKEVSRLLGVEVVPSFVFFRDGKVIGDPVSTSKVRLDEERRQRA